VHLFLDEIHSQAFLSTSTSLTLLVHEINKISSKSNRQIFFACTNRFAIALKKRLPGNLDKYN